MAASYVTFGSYNSRVDFHLDFIHREISPPAPKTAIPPERCVQNAAPFWRRPGSCPPPTR